MPPAVIAAGVGAAASIGGAVLSNNSTKKATQQAQDFSRETTAANNALARENRDFAALRIDPYAQRGNIAGNAYNAMLGLPSEASGIGSANISALGGYGPSPGYGQQPALNALMYDEGQAPGVGRYLNQMPMETAQMGAGGVAQPQMGYAAASAPQAGGMTQQAAMNGFRGYIDNSDYGFREGEGARGVNHLLASRGSINSGAALKEMERFKQNIQSGYRNEYLGHLNNQQAMGLSGASALAGVGNSYAGLVTANNQNAGDNAANAALIRGTANSNMWQGVAGGIGNALGSSYQWWGK